MALPGFIFGGDTGIKSPEDLARARAIAEALLMPQRPAQNVGEGLAVLGQAIRGRREMNAANRAQAAGDASAQDAVSQALNGGTFPAAPSGGGSPSSADASPSGSNYRDAIAGVESKGSGDYSAIGPTNPKLGRALGRYQVMEANIGPWSKEALGREVSPQEFLANPDIQDAIFDHQFGKYVQQYGNPQDAASAWFTGGPLSSGAKKKDVLGTTGAAYVDKFNRGIGGGPVANALSAAPQGQQVASLDPSIGVPPQAGPVAAALQLPQQAPAPQARPDVAAALNGAPAAQPGAVGGPGAVTPAGQRVLGQMMSPLPMGGRPMQMQPPQQAQAAPPLPSSQVSPDPMAPAAPPAQPSDNLPVMAGGSADAVQPGQGGPSVQQLMQAAQNPWLKPEQRALVNGLLAQKMKQQDPAYALDLADKKVKLQLEQQQLGGNFRGDSMDAQAWNILQTADPSSRQYATAYSIVSQPKTQLVQTANGMVPVQVPPQLPAWLKAPGDAGGPAGPVAGQAPAVPGAAAPSTTGVPQGASAPATPGAAIPGTKQPATEMQARNGAIGHILLNEVPTLGKTFQALADPKGQFLSLLGAAGNPWQSEDYQRAASSVAASVANVLYSLSGASSNPDEVRKQVDVLTPKFGDKPGTITDKLTRFKTYVRSIASEANDPQLKQDVEDAISQMDAPVAPDAGGVPGAPKAGAVEDGYRFKGGDPADQKNWEPVQ
jgi:hypothetical protein